MNPALDNAQEEVDDWEADYLPPVVIRIRPALKMTDEQFYKFCRHNADLRIERTARGDIIVLPLTDASTGHGNAELTADFFNWAEADGSGSVFGSSTGFRIWKKAVRAPDVSWVLKERLARLSRKEWRRFAPLCPDFVLELRSRTDTVPDLQDKMAEYLERGARLGWLINPPLKEVFIYRPGQPVERLDNPPSLSGETVLPGFTLDLSRLWRALEPF